jgi:allophanate hydrolase subunit 2
MGNSFSKTTVISTGTLNSAFMTQAGDNTLETVADNNLNDYIESTSNPFIIKSLIGSYSYAYSQGRGGSKGLTLALGSVLNKNPILMKNRPSNLNSHPIIDLNHHKKNLDL